MIGRRFLFLLLFTFAGLAALANAAPMLTATVNEMAPRSRRTAPEWVEVLLTSRSTGIREGVLEFAMIEWGDVIYRYRTHELAINSGDQRFRFMLPAATLSGTNTDRTLQLRFIEQRGTTLLGEFPLISSQRGSQSRVIAVVRPGFRAAGSETYPLWQTLRLERFGPDEGSRFDTTPIFFDPTDLPLDPLGFFPFDIVLIESDAFGKMREKAHAALAQWVNAGGSLCIMADRGLETEHVEAINQLAAVDPQWKPLAMDESGRVKVPGNMACARVNFGRMAVMSELPPEDVEKVSPTWRTATVFLWRLASGPAEMVERDGKWSLKKEVDVRDAKLQGQRLRLDRESRLLDAPIAQVIPRSIRVVPLWILATVIGVFVVLIGPGDWFFLGALRRRRFTWLVFPVIAVLVTVGTVYLVRRFMGDSDQACAIVISDIGANGRVLRETRIGFELPAAQHIETTPLKNSLCLPIGLNSFAFRRQPGGARTDVAFQGQYPARYDYIRPQRQWNPEVVRITSIVDAPDTSGIKWEALDDGFLEKTEGPDPKAMQAAGFGAGQDVSLSFFTKRGTRDFYGNPSYATWRHAITMTAPEDDGALLVQVSPNGFPRVDDLRILESKDPSRTVMVAAVRKGTILHVWRRLFFTGN